MKIDYSINPNSKYCLFADVPFRQGVNHLYLMIKGRPLGLSLSERVHHLVLGIFKLIPVLGHIIAFIDTLRARRNFITHLKLASTDPFTRGEEHGHRLRKRIKTIYDPILAMMRDDVDMTRKITELERQIPDALKEEMRGLAKGSGYPYEDVVLIHSFLDAEPGQFGCTSMAVKESNGKYQKIAAANHLVDEPNSIWNSSKSRRQAFLNEPIPKDGSMEKILKSAAVPETIQAMVFDTLNGTIRLSSRGTDAANGDFTTFEPDLLFNSHEFNHVNGEGERMILCRNLDWPWYFLGQQTVVLTRSHSNGSSTASVSFPGYIGTLSGMNNHGLALSENECGTGTNPYGIPNPLLLTNILDTCKNVHEAGRTLAKKQHASAINLVIADKISAQSYELKGKGALSCVGEIGVTRQPNIVTPENSS